MSNENKEPTKIQRAALFFVGIIIPLFFVITLLHLTGNISVSEGIEKAFAIVLISFVFSIAWYIVSVIVDF